MWSSGFGLMILAIANAVAQPAPLAPSGKWSVEYAEGACILSRTFGTAPAVTTVAFRPSPLGGNLQVIILSPGMKGEEYRRNKAKLTLQPSGRVIDSQIVTLALKAQNQSVITLTTNTEDTGELQKTALVEIEATDGTRHSFAVPGMEQAFVALDTCQDDLLRGWGIDPSERSIPSSQRHAARGNPSEWITNIDYPKDALKANQSGVVTIFWTIGIDGRVSDCHVISSSRVPSLDRAACNAIMKNAQYRPARDKDGRPVISHSARRVVWTPR